MESLLQYLKVRYVEEITAKTEYIEMASQFEKDLEIKNEFLEKAKDETIHSMHLLKFIKILDRKFSSLTIKELAKKVPQTAEECLMKVILDEIGALEQYFRFFILYRNVIELSESEKYELSSNIRFIIHDEMEHFFETTTIIDKRKLKKTEEVEKASEKIVKFWMMFYLLDTLHGTKTQSTVGEVFEKEMKHKLSSMKDMHVIFRIIDKDSNTAQYIGSIKEKVNLLKAIETISEFQLKNWVTPRSYLSVVLIKEFKEIEGRENKDGSIIPVWNPKIETVIYKIGNDIEELIFADYANPLNPTEILDAMLEKYEITTNDVIISKVDAMELSILCSK